MAEQLALFKETPVAETEKKPRLTLKAKKEALDDMYDQVAAGWDMSEGTERLLEWLRVDIQQSEARKGK
jgi:hypothetical protein